MNKSCSIAAALLLAAAAFGATPPSKTKVHGLSVAGTVASIEEPARKMVVKTSAGKQVQLVWTGATKTVGGATNTVVGSVKAGARVTVRYLEKDGKNIATSIRLEPDKSIESAGPAPAPATPTVTTGAKSR